MGSIAKNLAEGKEQLVDDVVVKKGAVLTIMGELKPGGETAIPDQQIYEIAGNIFSNFEVSYTPVQNVNPELTEEDKDSPFNTPAGRASAVLFTNVMSAADQAEDEAEDARWNALTPEQQAAEKEMYLERTREMYRELGAQSESHRNEVLGTYTGTAQRWADKPDLTPEERCYGVAHDLYVKYGPASGFNPKTGKDIQYNRSEDFSQRYDSVRERSMRAAKELFGG